jgi:hypothetical protein
MRHHAERMGVETGLSGFDDIVARCSRLKVNVILDTYEPRSIHSLRGGIPIKLMPRGKEMGGLHKLPSGFNLKILTIPEAP